MTTTREQRVDHYDVLTGRPAAGLQDLVSLVAHVCDVPTAVINIITRDHQHQIASAGFDPSVCAREDSMCALVLTEGESVVVPDASLDPRFADNAFVTGAIAAVRFYASAPLVTPDGFVLGRLCVFDDEPRDLTGPQTAALGTLARQVMDVLELRAVRDELRRSNEHLQHFAGQVSHDLRSPLTAIIATAEILAGEPAVGGDATVAEMVDAVGRAGARMNRMIEEMLNLALAGGRISVRATSVRDVVDLVLTDLAPAVAQGDADVTVHDLPTLQADPDMLYSIVLNLMTNALKFTREGAPARVEVSAERRGAVWRIRVDDNGRGIPEHLRAQVFATFERAADDVAGHGIGLATTRRLVEAHGGRCGAGTSAGGGASVWFELPA